MNRKRIRRPPQAQAEQPLAKLTAADIERARAILGEVEEINNRIAAARDELRGKMDQLDEIARRVDDGTTDIKRGIRYIAEGIDAISEQL